MMRSLLAPALSLALLVLITLLPSLSSAYVLPSISISSSSSSRRSSYSSSSSSGSLARTSTSTSCSTTGRDRTRVVRLLAQESSNNDDNDNDNSNEEEPWDANVDYEKEWPQENATPDPSSAWDALPNLPNLDNDSNDYNNKLGINLQLEPMSAQDAREIKIQAQQIINEKIDQGIEDIEILRTRMNKELEQSRQIQLLASELQAQQKSEELMNKIDRLTGNFLDSTKDARKSTKMAAAASKAMEGTASGLEMGTWGTLGGRTVVASSSSTSTSTLLGSVENAKKQQAATMADGNDTASASSSSSKSTHGDRIENRIVVIADTQQDQLAKQLMPVLTKQLLEHTDIPNLIVEVLTPTSNFPLGGNNAACVVVLCTSLSQASSLTNGLDRLLRKTLQPSNNNNNNGGGGGGGGQIGKPPTQLVGISTVGTERTEKFPYSMQNMMGGGKLDQRRQIEEVLMKTVQRRTSEPPLDYTLIKLGEFKENIKAKEFNFQPGDVLDEPTTVDAAAQAIVQAIAYQPFARNATFCVSGSLPPAAAAQDEGRQHFWDSTFLALEGPELWREENVGDVAQYDQLVEYVREWAEVLAMTGKGLTTPVQAVNEIISRSSHLMEQQDGVELLFLPTRTGRNYMSKDEERQREQDLKKGNAVSGSVANLRRNVREGGIDVVVEVTKEQTLRVRARRCNYADNAIVKELSEATIIKRLEKAMAVWENEHK